MNANVPHSTIKTVTQKIKVLRFFMIRRFQQYYLCVKHNEARPRSGVESIHHGSTHAELMSYNVGNARRACSCACVRAICLRLIALHK